MKTINGIPVDPELPEGFDDTPNDQRPESHQQWWHRPFILSDQWKPESFEQYRERLFSYGYEPDMTPEEWAETQAHQESQWFSKFPGGVRYVVRCLDGGAWDRSTSYGAFGSLEVAVEVAQRVGGSSSIDAGGF